MFREGITFSRYVSLTTDKKIPSFFTLTEFIPLAIMPKMTPRYISSGAFCPISDYQLQRLDGQE